jgi:hypothetical protein
MRIVEFVGFVVVAIAVFGWMIGRPHTLASVRRDAARDADPTDRDAAP